MHFYPFVTSHNILRRAVPNAVHICDEVMAFLVRGTQFLRNMTSLARLLLMNGRSSRETLVLIEATSLGLEGRGVPSCGATRLSATSAISGSVGLPSTFCSTPTLHSRCIHHTNTEAKWVASNPGTFTITWLCNQYPLYHRWVDNTGAL
jgi:hypothetical protein